MFPWRNGSVSDYSEGLLVQVQPGTQGDAGWTDHPLSISCRAILAHEMAH